MDEQGQDGLAEVQDRANKPFWDAVAGRISDSQNRANGIDPAAARVNPGANEAVAQGLVAFPKLVESLWTEVGYVPSGLGAPPTGCSPRRRCAPGRRASRPPRSGRSPTA